MGGMVGEPWRSIPQKQYFMHTSRSFRNHIRSCTHREHVKGKVSESVPYSQACTINQKTIHVHVDLILRLNVSFTVLAVPTFLVSHNMLGGSTQLGCIFIYYWTDLGSAPVYSHNATQAWETLGMRIEQTYNLKFCHTYLNHMYDHLQLSRHLCSFNGSA